jgi:hypothetical protein
MGQYRYSPDKEDYLVNILNVNVNDNDITYCTTINEEYQDIQIKLPVKEDDGKQIPIVQYNKTFYVRLTVPQNSEYDTILNLKLCPIKTSGTSSGPDLERFQHIKRFIIPATPEDDNDSSQVLLFVDPFDSTEKTIRAQV